MRHFAHFDQFRLIVTALVLSVSLAVWCAHVKVNRRIELADMSGSALLRSYRKETKMIDGPMDAEDGSLYSAPFR